MKGRQEGHIRYQPPCAAELERYPPRSSVCARFRGMLRDYADQDLSPRDRTAVDEHLHGCRDCSLALARAEHEVLRIRTALTGLGLTGLRSTEPGSPGRVPAGFTAKVLQQLHEQPAVPASKRHRWWILLPLAAAVLVGVRLGGDLWSSEPAGPVLTARTATDTAWVHGGRELEVRQGDALTGGGLLEVGPEGHAELSSGPDLDPDAVFNVEGDSLLYVGSELPSRERESSVLYRGALTVLSGDRVSGWELAVPGAGRINLGSGTYHVSAVPFRRFDAALTSEALVRVRLEVLRGEPAEILGVGVPGAGEMRRVQEGEVALFDGWSPVVISRALDPQRLSTAMSSARDTGVGPTVITSPEMWLGRLTDADGRGLSGASVDVKFSRGIESVVTDSEGRFRTIRLTQLRGEDIVLQVTPPDFNRGLAVLGPVPRKVPESPNGVGSLLGSVQLEAERPVSGWVRDEDIRSVVGARVVPLLMDELLGVVQPLWALAAQTDVEGRFVVHGVPPSLEPHTSLVLLVDHAEYAPAVSHALAGTPSQRDRLIELTLMPGQAAKIPRDVAVEVGVTLPGLPPQAVLWLGTRADAGGQATIRTGPGIDLWVPFMPGVRSDLQALTIGPDGLAQRGPSRPRAATAVAHRYGEISTRRVGRSAVFSVVDAQSNAARGNTRLFLLSDHSPAVYLGEYDGLTGFSTMLPAGDTRILALGPNGSTGLLDVPADGPEHVQIQTQNAGGLELDAPSQPALQGPDTLALELEALDGDLSGRTFTRLVARDQDWESDGLVPGLYRVTASDGRTGTCRVEPGRAATLTLR